MRVLFVVPGLTIANGISSYALSYFKKLHAKVEKFDFLLLDNQKTSLVDEITKLGGHVYFAPNYKKTPVEFLIFLVKLLTYDKYDVVHCNVINSGSLILGISKMGGVPVRIIHSHTTRNGDTRLKRMRNYPFAALARLFANNYIACSRLAGTYLFGNRNFRIVRNAMDSKELVFQNEYRDAYRTNNDFVVGTVGRFTLQKNPEFILEIIQKLVNDNFNFEFWWIGEGELLDDIKKQAAKRKIDQYIKFWGPRTDVKRMYSGMDCFILPSLYEGLPVVGIEAQMSGLPTILSNTITTETSISESVAYLSIDEVEPWIEEIKRSSLLKRQANLSDIDFKSYDIDIQANNLLESYKKMVIEK